MKKLNFNVETLLSKWLKKNGISNYYSMTEEEKATYKNIEETLRGKKLTDEDVERFWEDLIDGINAKLTAENLSDKERDFLIVELRLARKIISFLTSPETQASNVKMMVEQQLSA